jgi:hypothetical protein
MTVARVIFVAVVMWAAPGGSQCIIRASAFDPGSTMDFGANAWRTPYPTPCFTERLSGALATSRGPDAKRRRIDHDVPIYAREGCRCVTAGSCAWHDGRR